jgi:hypothetical protein
MTTAKSQEAGAAQTKRARVSTVSYPYHPLELCIEFAKAVREIGNGRTDVTKSQLAHRLGVSEQSGDFAQKIASSKTYGLLDGKQSLRLTETSNQFFFPTDESPEATKLCLLKFFESPGAFRALIVRYDGSKPASPAVIANILGQNYGIPESWKSRVASFFIKSAQYAGAMGPDGFLRFKAQLDGMAAGGLPAAETAEIVSPKQPLGPPVSHPAAIPRQNQAGIIVWSYPCGEKFVRIETPETMTKEVWDKVNKYIQILEP